MIEQKKTLAEIAEEIKSARVKIERIKYEIEKSENEFFALDDNTRTKYLLDTPKADRIMRKWEEQRAEVAKLEKIALILRHNYRVALAALVLPAFLEILQKYGGKKAGEKTREKINEEMRTACGCSLWFERNYCSQKSEVVHIGKTIREAVNGENIDIYTKSRAVIIDEENTINGNLTADSLYINTGEYIDNPAQRLEEIEKARATVEEIKKQYNDAAEKYNNLIVQGFEKVEKIYK